MAAADYQARRQTQAENTRRAILDAASRLTREEGFDKLTIRDICHAAGVTTGAFYHHFSSKEDILNQGFASLDSYLEKTLLPYMDAPPLERLEAQLRSYSQYVEEMGWQTMALYYIRRLSDPEAGTISPNRYTLKTMEECLTALKDAGTLSPNQEPRWVADFFFRHFRGTVIDWILHQGSYPLGPTLEQDYGLFYRAFQA